MPAEIPSFDRPSPVVDHVLHFEGGSASPYVGGYEQFVAQREERRLTQQREFDKQSKTIAAEEDYIRRNLAGQNTKQAKGRRKKLARLPRLNAPMAFSMPPPQAMSMLPEITAWCDSGPPWV